MTSPVAAGVSVRAQLKPGRLSLFVMKRTCVLDAWLVAVTLVAGCGSSAARLPATSSPHATVAAGARHVVARVPVCAAAALTLSPGPLVSPMTGEHADLFTLTNVSRQACVLDGYPRIALRHDGKPLPFVYRDGGGQYLTARGPQRVTIRPGSRAYVLVAKYRCDGAVVSSSTSIRLLLPGSEMGALTLHLRGPGVGGLDYCRRYPGDAKIDPGNRVAVSPIVPSVADATAQAPAPPPTMRACRASQLTGSLALWGAAGGNYSYRGTLRNVSKRRCTLDGYPRLVALSSSGRPARIADRP